MLLIFHTQTLTGKNSSNPSLAPTTGKANVSHFTTLCQTMQSSKFGSLKGAAKLFWTWSGTIWKSSERTRRLSNNWHRSSRHKSSSSSLLWSTLATRRRFSWTSLQLLVLLKARLQWTQMEWFNTQVAFRSDQINHSLCISNSQWFSHNSRWCTSSSLSNRWCTSNSLVWCNNQCPNSQWCNSQWCSQECRNNQLWCSKCLLVSQWWCHKIRWGSNLSWWVRLKECRFSLPRVSRYSPNQYSLFKSFLNSNMLMEHQWITYLNRND